MKQNKFTRCPNYPLHRPQRVFIYNTHQHLLTLIFNRKGCYLGEGAILRVTIVYRWMATSHRLQTGAALERKARDSLPLSNTPFNPPNIGQQCRAAAQ